MQKVIDQYLQKFAEPEIDLINGFSFDKTYSQCIVIPAYNESYDFINRFLHTFSDTQDTLLIVVINQPNTDHNIDKNKELLIKLCQTPSGYQQEKNVFLIQNNSDVDLLLIDRFSQKIPQQQGVGLARKIGVDIACRLFREGALHTQWIGTSDADAHLPKGYFSALENIKLSKQASAVIFPHRHSESADQAITKATLLYEKALAYYVEQLKQAGSPYAFQTLGSCIAVNLQFYCQARGFPKRSGGEDFYLLNKLAKLGTVLNLDEPQITIESRLSERVPFGTGPAVKKIVDMTNPEQNYHYYHPQVFDQLELLLQRFPDLFSHRKQHNQDDTFNHWLGDLSTPLQDALTALNIESLFAHLNKQAKTHAQSLNYCHEWMDAFRTLKLIHYLRAYHPDQPLMHSLHDNE